MARYAFLPLATRPDSMPLLVLQESPEMPAEDSADGFFLLR